MSSALRFRFATTPVEVSVASGPLHHAVAEAFRQFGYTPESEPGEATGQDAVSQRPLRLCVETAERLPGVPSGARRFESDEAPFTMWMDGETAYLADSVSLFAVDLAAQRAEGHVDAKALRREGAGQEQLRRLLVASVGLMLRERGFFAMHAAALCRDGIGLLLVAQSDAGKSTTAYSLVRHGWDYLSDDVVLLYEKGGLIEAAPFRKHFGLDTEAGGYFPELDRDWERPFAEEDKWLVRVDDLFPGRLAAHCTPRVIAFPQIDGREGTEVDEMPRFEALRELVQQSGLSSIMPETSQRQLDRMAALLSQVHTYRVCSGRDLIKVPSRSAEVYKPLLRKARAAFDG